MLKTILSPVACFILAGAVAVSCSSESDPPAATPDGGGTGDGGGGDGSARPDSTTGDGSTSTCTPADVTGYTPSWKPPTAFNQGVCDSTLVEALVDCMFSETADEAVCEALMDNPVNEDCMTCLFTEETDAQHGPIVFVDDFGTVNSPGCVANVEGVTTSAGCGAKVAASVGCTAAACDAVCPGEDDEALAEYDACTEEALETVCATYSAAADCADALEVEPCYPSDDFTASAVALGKLFCAGGGGGDGGADTGAD